MGREGNSIVGGECDKSKRGKARGQGRYLSTKEVRALRKCGLLERLVFIFSAKARAVDNITRYADGEAGYQQIANDLRGLYLEDEQGREYPDPVGLAFRLGQMRHQGKIDELDERTILAVLFGTKIPTEQEWQALKNPPFEA